MKKLNEAENKETPDAKEGIVDETDEHDISVDEMYPIARNNEVLNNVIEKLIDKINETKKDETKKDETIWKQRFTHS